MSSEGANDAESPDPALVSEIDGLVERIKALHEGHGRAISKKIKRARKGRKDMAVLETFGVPVPQDLRALYWNWNGAERGGRMTFWDANVFFDWMWPPVESLVDTLKIAQLENHTHSKRAIRVGLSWRRDDLTVFPDLDRDGSAPLAATAPWAERIYFAFDGIVPMLRSIIAAEEAGVISYASERITGEDGKIAAEENEIQYDPAALWDIIAPLNPRVEGEEHNYWRALADGILEYDGEPPDISSGKIVMKPEVQEIVFREVVEQKKNWDDALRDKPRDE